MKKLGTDNPDIGFDKDGSILLRNPRKKTDTINTNVNYKDYYGGIKD